jgi:phosphoglycolate phosphatase-like HAD superfamily hydrolase
VRECLQTLTASGYELGIYTGTREDALESQLRYHNIKQYFQPQYLHAKNNARDAAMNSDMLKAFQLRRIIEQRGDRNIIVIGDSFADFKAAEREGLSFIAFAPGAKGRELWQNINMQAAFGDYASLPALLERYGNPAAAPAKKSGPRL